MVKTLKEEAHTGKEIIDDCREKEQRRLETLSWFDIPDACKACRREINHGRGRGQVCITDKGKKTSEDIDRVGQAVKKQIDTMMALGNVGKFCYLIWSNLLNSWCQWRV